MEADWDELSRIPMPPPSPHGMPTNATAVAFDDVMELLWAGNEYVSWNYSAATSIMKDKKGSTNAPIFFSCARVE